MTNNVRLYIELPDGKLETIDLYEERGITVNSSVQNIKDVSKIFSDYSREFDVPPTNNNNKIFKHYYNVDISEGYNSQVSVDAIIEVGYQVFKRGKLKLLLCNMKEDKINSYKVYFNGELSKLTDTLGTDTLNDLDLSAYDHQNNFTEIYNKMSGTDDVIYPLISSERNWRWNSGDEDDIRYDAENPYGINTSELKPSLRVYRIIQAIEDKYGITFSRDFFNDTSHFNDLFLFGNREFEVQLGLSEFNYQSVVLDGDNSFKAILYGPISTLFGAYSWKYTLTITPEPGFEDIQYRVLVDNTTESPLVTGVQTFEYSSQWNGTTVYKFIDFKFKPEDNFSFSASMEAVKVVTNVYGQTTTNISYGPTINTIESNIVNMSNINSGGVKRVGVMPNMTVRDFLNALVNQFNLVMVPGDNDIINVQTVDDWYADGVENDITEYIDNTSHKILRPDLPSKITFKYEESEDIVSSKYRQINNKTYGDLEASFDYDGTPLEIEIPFANPLGTTLVDAKAGTNTDVFVTKLIELDNDNKGEVVDPQPIMFYMNLDDTPTSGSISVLNDSGAPIALNTYNVVKQTNNIDNSKITQSLNFGDELDGYSANGSTFLSPPINPNSGVSYSLYGNYWKKFITDLYDPRRRVFKYTGIFPPNVLTSLHLNNKIIISDRRYIINNLKTNIVTGKVEMELLNDIYVNNLDVLHATINVSSSRLTCNYPTASLTASNSTGKGLTYSWSTVGGTIDSGHLTDTIIISESGDYTVTITDENLSTDNYTVSITDDRTNPTVSIIPSSTKLSYENPTITLTSTLTDGYSHTWSGGDIISGQGTSQIEINSPGTYVLISVTNNTGCVASDTQIITQGDMELPSVPVNLRATDIGDTNMTFRWDDSTDDVEVLNYDVYIDDVFLSTTTSTSYDINGLTKDQTYKLQVFSRDTSNHTSELSIPIYPTAGVAASGSTGPAGSDGDDGLNAVVERLLTYSSTVKFDSDGLNGDYSDTNNIISVFEGNVQLQFVTGTPSAGEYRVDRTYTGITPGDIVTSSGEEALVGISSNMTTDVASIIYNISIRRLDNTFLVRSIKHSFNRTIDGEDGIDGTDGLPGLNGDDGAPGQDGDDGRTTYFHVAYADDINGNGFSQSPTGKDYIGTYVDFTQTDSNTPSDYVWTLYVGIDGTNGIPGTNGVDGETSYLHIAYSNSSNGSVAFSTSDPTGRSYIGQYTNFTLEDSTNPSTYTWSLIKGSDGVDGSDGSDGSDGDNGKVTSTGIVYYLLPSETVPTRPASNTYSFVFSTGSFTSLPSNWSTIPPEASGNNRYWISRYNVVESSPGSNTGLASFTTSVTSFLFTDLVTFTNLSTPGSTTIDGGNISTGTIDAIDITGSSITGGTLNGTTINGGVINIGGSDTTSFHVNSVGRMWTGSSSYGSAPFRVNNNGDLYTTELNVDAGGYIQSNDPSVGGFFLNNEHWLLSDQTLNSSGTVIDNGCPIWFGNSSRQIVGEYTENFGSPRGLLIEGDGYIRMTTANSPNDFVSIDGDLRVTGNVTGYYSDMRLKDMVGHLENPMDKINKLDGFLYVNNETAKSFGYTDTKHQVGLSAQQVQGVLPEVVSPAPFDLNTDGTSKSGENYLTVDYAKLVPLLVEGIKELSKEINELKKRIK